MREAVHRQVYHLRTAELGVDAKASSVALCALLQESANLHAHLLGVSLEILLERGYTWFLSRLQLRVERFPAWRDAVTVETWPSAVEGPFAVRDFRLFDNEGLLLGLATSHWILIDTARHRPVRRLPPFLLSLHPQDAPRALETEPKRLPLREGCDLEATTQVRRADLDLNGHLNSIIQIQLLLEAAPAMLAAKGHLRELVVEFKSEGKGGETLVVRAAKLHGQTPVGEIWLHDLLAGEEERVVARAQVTWTS